MRGTTLRWGILGPGRIASRVVRAIAATSRAELTAVASRDLNRAATFAKMHGAPLAFGTYEELLASPRIDVVYVALPNHLHAAWTIRALEAGKHVLCEKPLALSVAEADGISAAARRSGRVAVEAFMYLHHPQTLRAVELARDGGLGTLELVHGSFSFFLTHPNDPRTDPEMGGGSIWDVGCYPVSLARRIAGEEPVDVSAFARYDSRGIDRTFVGLLRFPGGLMAEFDCGFAAPDRQRVEIVGQHASLVLEAPFLPQPDGPPPSLTIWRGHDPTSIEVAAVDQYAAEVEDLTAVILDGTQPRVSLDFSRNGVATLVALDRAAREHQSLLELEIKSGATSSFLTERLDQ